jgi:hypothetical protein
VHIVAGANSAFGVYGVRVVDPLAFLAVAVPEALIPDPADASTGTVHQRLRYGITLPVGDSVLRVFDGRDGSAFAIAILPTTRVVEPECSFVVSDRVPDSLAASRLVMYLGARGVIGRLCHYTLALGS